MASLQRPTGVRCSASACKATRRQVLSSVPLLGAGALLGGRPVQAAQPQCVWDYKARMFDEERALSAYKNQNVNYPGLRTLYEKYRADGFNLVAFPCNQFGGQAPGSSEDERAWAHKKFGFSFDVFDKIEVNGPGAHPLYGLLRQQQPLSYPYAQGTAPLPEGRLEWNYVKFLVDRQGRAVKRYKPAFDPLQFEDDVRLLLAGRNVLPPECYAHPGRNVCNVERLLA